MSMFRTNRSGLCTTRPRTNLGPVDRVRCSRKWSTFARTRNSPSALRRRSRPSNSRRKPGEFNMLGFSSTTKSSNSNNRSLSSRHRLRLQLLKCLKSRGSTLVYHLRLCRSRPPSCWSSAAPTAAFSQTSLRPHSTRSPLRQPTLRPRPPRRRQSLKLIRNISKGSKSNRRLKSGSVGWSLRGRSGSRMRQRLLL